LRSPKRFHPSRALRSYRRSFQRCFSLADLAAQELSTLPAVASFLSLLATNDNSTVRSASGTDQNDIESHGEGSGGWIEYCPAYTPFA
jgi:hypothetical protein